MKQTTVFNNKNKKDGLWGYVGNNFQQPMIHETFFIWGFINIAGYYSSFS